ncbi:hypothetical protein PORY_001028 [Pneumocystis oryctolagi]|uniref:Uncharacterized protein n=1 Tax=Pneumocystis oryctolagi TaxID=42067 RepID=A0ACB7CG05_9ASCO|nr:hypothetical protein PORY_001028 [Pneumocystis oryctolagi]
MGLYLILIVRNVLRPELFQDLLQFQRKQPIFTHQINRSNVSFEKNLENKIVVKSIDMSPAVASLVKYYNIINPSEIRKTGPRGRLLKGDVLAYVSLIDKDYPLKLLKALEKKKSIFNIKQKQLAEDPFTTITIPVCLDALLSLEKSVNEKLFKIDFSSLINKAVYNAFKSVPSIILKKVSYQEILFSSIIGETLKYDDINNENFTEYFKGKKTSILWELPKNIKIENITFPPSISLTIEKILETPLQSLEKNQKDLDIIDFLAKDRFSESFILTEKNISQHTTFIKIKFDKFYTDIRIANSYINSLKKYLETPNKLLL